MEVNSPYKAKLRVEIREYRKQISLSDYNYYNHLLINRLKDFLTLIEPNPLLLRSGLAYYPQNLEPGGASLIQSLVPITKHIYLPVIDEASRTLRWSIYQGEGQLQMNKWGIKEPVSPPRSLRELAAYDFLLVPALALDIAGNRLGRGGGFYDKQIADLTKNIPIIGLCFDQEVKPSIPTETTDQKVDFIITPTRLLDCRDKLRKKEQYANLHL